MKTLIYIRVSTDRQDNSIEMQKDKCVTFCKSKGYDIVDILVDEISGGSKIFSRPQGSKLKDYLNNIDRIVVLKLDRLSRSLVDGLNFIETVNKKGVEMSIIDLNGDTVETQTAMGKFFLSLMLSLNELERGIISERTSNILQNKKKNLKVYSNKAPFGFKKKGDTLIPVRKELDKVRDILNKCDTQSKRSLSIQYVVNYNVVNRIIKDKEFYLTHL